MAHHASSPHSSAPSSTPSTAPSGADWAIRVEKLERKFGDFTAVNGISLNVGKGEVMGFLGPNGAGKTTTISMLITLLEPTSGNAWVNGFNIRTQSDDVRKSIGIVFQDPALDDELTALENLQLHARLYRVQDVAGRAKEVLDLVELWDKKDNIVKTFSGGMKRRLEIARGLMHSPKVLFLDEPTLGLDVQTRQAIWKYLKRLKEQTGMTVVLTTHYLEEADALSDRIAIIDKGVIVALDTPANLKRKNGNDLITFKTTNNALVVSKIKGITRENGNLMIQSKAAEKDVVRLAQAVEKSGAKLLELDIKKPSLESVFISLTGHAIRDDSASQTEMLRNQQRMWRR